MKKIIALLLLLSPFSSYANDYNNNNKPPPICVRVYDLKGFSSSQSNGEFYQNDEFSGKYFDFVVQGPNVYPQDPAMKDLKYINEYPVNIFGFFNEGDKSNIETWNIDLKTKKVYFNRTRTGFPMLNGNSAYIGKVRNCDK